MSNTSPVDRVPPWEGEPTPDTAAGTDDTPIKPAPAHRVPPWEDEPDTDKDSDDAQR